jgi:ferric-dicitrate binding protein FerR (iron transport regulator)
MQVDQIENEDYFLWIDGIYAFENEQLIGIIKRLELYYDVKITLANPEMFRVNYTGKFRQRDGIEDILQVIQRIHKFKIEINREKNTIILQ